MENIFKSSQNGVLIQGATLSDIEAIVNRAIEAKMKDFYESIRHKPPVLVKRKVAAQRLGISLPTLLSYTKAGFLHPVHLGGQIFYDEEDLERYRQKNK